MCRCAIFSALLVFVSTASAQEASFLGLGFLPGHTASSASGLSADGRTVVGMSTGASGQEAFVWVDSVMTGLGDLPGGVVGSRADGVAGDSVAVGFSWTADGAEAFRWSSTLGMVGLGDLPGGNVESLAHGVSADGSVVVGEGVGADDGTQAFRWTANGGMVGLGDLPGGGKSSSYAYGVSADGQVVVGRGRTDAGTEAFMWTPAGGMVGLGFLAAASGGSTSVATAVSADGTVIVGGAGSEAFRWSASTGMVGLGVPPGATASSASAVSANGAVIVGGSGGGTNPGAFIWTEQDGMRSLRDVLIGAGVDMTGWTLQNARGVSADGSVVVGDGTNPQGFQEAWRAVLPGQCEEPLALRSWLNPSGGEFADPGNWSASAVPAGGDRALFGLGDGVDYTVSFASGLANDQVLLRGGNHVRFALGGQAYSLTGAAGCGPSLDVADAFATPRLEIEGGVVSALRGVAVSGPQGTEVVARAGGTYLVSGGVSVGVEVGRTGHVRIQSGGELSSTSEGVSIVGGAGAGSLTVEGGGDAAFFGLLRLGESDGGQGEVLATGVGARLSLFGPAVVGVAGDGGLTAGGSALIDARDIVLGRMPGGVGALVSETNGRIEARDVEVGVDGTGVVIIRTLATIHVAQGVSIPRGSGSGRVRVAADGGLQAGIARVGESGVGEFIVSGLAEVGQLLVGPQGTLSASGGCLSIAGGPCQSQFAGTGGSVQADTVWIGPGAAFDSTSVQLGPGGVLGGAGTVPFDLTNAGTINPGDSAGVAGTFTIGGAYTQAPAGVLEAELSGATSHDALAVTGAATLDGALRFSYIGGFSPAPGDAFTILTAASVAGEFSAVEGPVGSTYSIAYGPTSVTATVLTVDGEPGPGAAGLVLHPPAPNPSGGSVTVRYEIPVAGRVRLTVYDALGREVAVLVDGDLPAGGHAAAIAGNRLAPGAYSVILEAGGGAISRRIAILR